MLRSVFDGEGLASFRVHRSLPGSDLEPPCTLVQQSARKPEGRAGAGRGTARPASQARTGQWLIDGYKVRTLLASTQHTYIFGSTDDGLALRSKKVYLPALYGTARPTEGKMGFMKPYTLYKTPSQPRRAQTGSAGEVLESVPTLFQRWIAI